MKIKLALLDSDQNYLNRIVTAFNIKYADKLEIYSFTKLESAMAALEPSRIDVLVASDTFVVESSALPKRCQLAYFVESAVKTFFAPGIALYAAISLSCCSMS